EVQRKRARLVQLEADWKRFGAERERAQKEVDRVERDVSLALAKDREDLARYALKQALTQKNLVERIGARMAESAEEQRELGLALQSQQVTLEELRARVQAFLSQRESGCLEVRVLPVTDEQIELELMRRKAQPAARAEDAPEARDGSK
ncbi:MAG TPA: hypothetical protein VFQ35_28065, partial [Polyangiaceae bacterium]|nr:hypothetical protein [Polyangiaceae bacterium]